MREVTCKWGTFVGHSIPKNSAFALSKAYKEFIINPEFPQVLTCDSLTGEMKTLDGIQVS